MLDHVKPSSSVGTVIFLLERRVHLQETKPPATLPQVDMGPKWVTPCSPPKWKVMDSQHSK